MWKSFNNKKQKAVLITNGKPVFGEIGNVRVEAKTGKILVTLVTPDGETAPFDVKKRLETEEFKLISNDVFSMINKAAKKENNKPKSRHFEERELKHSSADELSGVKRGAIVETMILSGRYQGIWVKAQVTQVDRRTMDLRVLLPKKWKVAGIALGVPKQHIRAVAVDEAENYIVPIEFLVDDSILYLGCSKRMRIKHLKITVSREKGINIGQLFFMNRGQWLEEDAPIPNDVIFCIIHTKGTLTPNQVDMIDLLKKKKQKSLKKKESPPMAGLGVL